MVAVFGMWVLWLCFGLAAGSCADLIVWRLPRKLLDINTDGLFWPPSHCQACAHRLGAWELLPVLGFVLLRGRCRSCGEAIAWRHPALELLTAGLFGYCAIRFGLSWQALIWALAWLGFAILALIDWDFFLLPSTLTWALLVAGLSFAVSGWNAALDGQDAILGSGCAYAVLISAAWVFKRIRGQSGLGAGDAKLFAALGAWVGWQLLWSILFWAAVLGLGLALRRWLHSKHLKPHQTATSRYEDINSEWFAAIPADALPFGTTLVLAALLHWLEIVPWLHQGFLGFW